MRNRTFVVLGSLTLVGGIGFLSIAGSRGQPPAIPQPLPVEIRKEPAIPTALPPAPVVPIRPVTSVAPALRAAPADRYRNFALLPPATRESVLRCQFAIDWLFASNLNGRFTPGRSPALNQPFEIDNPLWQAKATFAACRAARFTGRRSNRSRHSRPLWLYFFRRWNPPILADA